jgi:hypothetical protein
MKTNKGLVEYAKAQLGKPYWYGTYGKGASRDLYTSKKKQYPTYYLWSYNAAEEGIKVHDCVGLIKGYLWCNSPYDALPRYNSAQDKSANGMRNACVKKGDIATLPEVEGVLVFMSGHVGVYIGNGEVIEARGRKYGVVKTKLKERKWKWWGYCPYITYAEKPKEVTKVNVELTLLRKGAEGAEVKTLQRLLIALGYKMKNGNKTYGVDGSFGQATLNAVKQFQKASGLDDDGEVGVLTWSKLLKG